MRSDDIENALQELLGASVEHQGIVLTLRRHDEYEALIERIRGLQKENDSLKSQRICRKHLDKLGVDTSFITSLRPR